MFVCDEYEREAPYSPQRARFRTLRITGRRGAAHGLTEMEAHQVTSHRAVISASEGRQTTQSLYEVAYVCGYGEK